MIETKHVGRCPDCEIWNCPPSHQTQQDIAHLCNDWNDYPHWLSASLRDGVYECEVLSEKEHHDTRARPVIQIRKLSEKEGVRRVCPEDQDKSG